MSKEINNLNNGLNDIYATKDEVEEFQTIVSEAYNDIGEALGYIGNEVIGPMQNDIDNLEIDINNINRKMGDPSNLQTTEKGNLVGAINELFQSANNGKQLIANAIGEPLSSDDTFSAMSNDINGLLSTFKTNMMNNGVTVESGDKFKELIEKIKGLTEGEGNKGIQYAEITQSFSVYKTSGVSAMGNSVSLTKDVLFDIDFEPTIIILDLPQLKGPGLNSDGRILLSLDAPKYTFSQPSYTMSVTLTELTSTNAILTFRGNALGASSQQSEVLCSGNIKIYAIGVGEEDTTLLDSLKSILAEEGVTTTEEDDMASLISKVDEEFDRQNNEMENLKQDLIDILTNRGISVEEGLTSEELVNKIDEGTKLELKAGTSGTYLVTFVSSTVDTYSDGVERTINGTINFNKNKFRITGVSISYSTECEVTTKCNTSLVQYRNDNAIKTHFSVDGKNTIDFGSWSGTVTDVQHGDIFKFVTRHQQVSTTSSAWIRHTLKITCVINI